MKKRNFKSNNMPPRISLIWPLVIWMVLERFAAPTWLFGVVFTLLTILYIAEIARLLTAEAVDVLGNDKP